MCVKRKTSEPTINQLSSEALLRLEFIDVFIADPFHVFDQILVTSLVFFSVP